MTSRRVPRLSENRRSTSKPVPAILSRKRKSDQEDLMQPDIQNYFPVLTSKTDSSENVMSNCGISFANIGLSNPPTSSRVPLATLSLSSSQNIPDDPVESSTGGYALKLPGARHSSTPAFPTTPTSSLKIQNSRRKQTLSWKKPKMRESWSKFRAFINQPCVAGSRGVAPLPELSWARKQEMWDLMAKKETGMYQRLGAQGMLQKHPALQARMRAILLDWLIEVCEVYRLHRETFYLAVDFIDRFLGVAGPVPKNRLQLIGITCLFIGAKIEEIYPPKLQEFAYVTDGACTEDEILSMELVVLKGLNWGLSPMTPNSWMRMFMQISTGDMTPYSDSFILPAYSGLPFSKSMQLLDLCVLDLGSLEFTYSVLATSALYHTENEALALHVSGYQWKDIASCVRWMSAFAFALRESGPLQPRFFPGIQPDDAHHIQSHSVDLDMLAKGQSRLQELATGANRDSPDPENHPPPPSGLDNTPQEDAGDIMYPPSMTSHVPSGRGFPEPHPALLSPPADGDIW